MSVDAFADGIAEALGTRFDRRHPRARRTLRPRAIRRRDRGAGARPRRRRTRDDPSQPAARRLSRHLRRAARPRRLHPRVRDPVPDRHHPDHARPPAASAVRQRPPVHRRRRAARLLPAGALSPAPRPLARRRFLRGLRRQHPRRRLRRRRHVVRADLLRERCGTRRRRVPGVAARVGDLPGPERRRSPTRRAN